MQNYSIEAGKHSADKDHRVMTGGTLTVDKTIICSEGITFHTYNIAMFSGIPFDELFHKRVHTAEHMLAYKKDTGSFRDSLEEVTSGEKEGKVILDISPYKTGEDSFGFRITSMIPLEVEEIQKLVKMSVERAVNYLASNKRELVEDDTEEDYQGIPFSRSVSCGQYDFHDRQGAAELLQNINVDNLSIEEVGISIDHTSAYVCDLRFLKPKTFDSNGMVMFSPDFSYKLSKLIELELPNKLPGSIAIVGTFGCMTGMYLCISSEKGDETDIKLIHQYIIEIIEEEINEQDLNEHEKIELQTLLDNYQKYGK